jgi:hypothetical protein
MLSRMGYEYRIAVSAQRSDIETALGRIQACQRNGDEFVYQGGDPTGWPEATAVVGENGVYFLANSTAGKSLLGRLLVALASLGSLELEEL